MRPENGIGEGLGRGVGPITAAGWPETDQPSLERAIAEIAVLQHGVIALYQLIALGLSDRAVRHRVAAGRLHRIHRGVYAVGHAKLTVKGRYMAAVLACGPGAVLSHRSAADLLGLRATQRARIDVTAPGRAGKSRAGIDAHRATSLLPRDTTRVDGIPCTSIARTVLDLAEVLPPRAVERACDRAEQLRAFDLRAFPDVLDRANGRRGAATVRRILAGYAIGERITRNDLEEAFLAICHEAGVPTPRVNHWIALPGNEFVEGDFVWPDLRLIVETDGNETHGTRRGLERDHRRDRSVRRAGWRVERFTWLEVTAEPAAVAAALGEIVSTSAAGPASARPRS